MKNSQGSSIFSLPANLKDPTLAIAFLSEKGVDVVDSPIYKARTLIRLAYSGSGDPILITTRPFYDSKESRHILLDGLSNRLENIFHVGDIKPHLGGRCSRFVIEIGQVEVEYGGEYRIPYIDDTEIIYLNEVTEDYYEMVADIPEGFLNRMGYRTPMRSAM